MCRFVAYLGKQILLGDVLEKPVNSLVSQSKQAREEKRGLNADGFGIGWYDFNVDSKPGLFKSTQPAWNDYNLNFLLSKIQSTCFIGHVRASTVGDVNIYNCHPFSFNQFMFVHNGTIRGFEQIKRQVLGLLSDKLFETIKGQTDSEHFFALVMDILHQNGIRNSANDLVEVLQLAIRKITKIHDKYKQPGHIRLNTVLTDGKQLVATRYALKSDEPSIPLYYTVDSNHFQDAYSSENYTSSKHFHDAIMIASEPLTDCREEWIEIPDNSIFVVNTKKEVTLKIISNQ